VSTDNGSTSAAATKVWSDTADAYPFQSTFFDTPEGTRAIPAFLALKGKRSSALDLTNHSEARLKHLPHWTQMDFVRRLSLDLGEVGIKEGVTDIEAAAREVVRLVNQGGALQGRSNQRRPADQYPVRVSGSILLSKARTVLLTAPIHRKKATPPRHITKPISR